jgi:hypothetical protein
VGNTITLTLLLPLTNGNIAGSPLNNGDTKTADILLQGEEC